MALPLLATTTLVLLLAGGATAQYPQMTLTLVNNCPYTVWPGIQPNSGHDVLESGGFELPTHHHRSFLAPTHHWSGRIWARTGCTSYPHFSCVTGDCGPRVACGGAGGAPPATLAQIILHHGDHDQTSYGVSLVDGYNVGMTVTPHDSRGLRGVCPVIGCRANLLRSCPDVLQVRAPVGGGTTVVACKSGCLAYNSDELCCRNKYNSPMTCRASEFSKFFKRECPETFTYAHDSPSLTHDCAEPQELKVIFCHDQPAR